MTQNDAAALDQAERLWSRSNPQGQADQAANGSLALWNFDIGSAELKTEHEAALRALVAPLVLQSPRSATSFVVSGYASSTGSEASNDRLAGRRAEVVAQWLDSFGFTAATVAQNPGMQVVPGDDGATLARNRRVEILRYDRYPQPAPQPIAPEFVVDRVTASQLPPNIAVSQSAPPEEALPDAEQGLPDWIPRRLAAGFTFPDADIARIDNEWVKARVRFEGAVRVAGGDRRSARTLTLMTKELNRAEVSLSQAITDWLAFKIQAEQPNPRDADSFARGPNVRAGVTATLTTSDRSLGGELEVSVQPLRWRDEFVYLGLAITALVPVTIAGQTFTLAVTGKVKATGVPGPSTLRVAARIATAVAEEAAAAAPYMAAAVILTLAFTIGAALVVESAREGGVRHAQHIAARDAFAARVAFEVVGQPAMAELESLMNEWRRFQDAEVTATAERSYNSADRDIKALAAAGGLDAAKTNLTTRYGQVGGTADLSFHGVRLRIFDALGGFDAQGPTDFRLDQLLQQ